MRQPEALSGARGRLTRECWCASLPNDTARYSFSKSDSANPSGPLVGPVLSWVVAVCKHDEWTPGAVTGEFDIVALV